MENPFQVIGQIWLGAVVMSFGLVLTGQVIVWLCSRR